LHSAFCLARVVVTGAGLTSVRAVCDGRQHRLPAHHPRACWRGSWRPQHSPRTHAVAVPRAHDVVVTMEGSHAKEMRPQTTRRANGGRCRTAAAGVALHRVPPPLATQDGACVFRGLTCGAEQAMGSTTRWVQTRKTWQTSRCCVMNPPPSRTNPSPAAHRPQHWTQTRSSSLPRTCLVA